ncbi:MAG: hypothetical protein HQL72_02600 [Magnetococcales bacterium]|nr:hypothetical protein [Magnetococcales bacterium]
MDLEAIIEIVTAAVTLASTIAAVTKTPEDDNWVGKIYRILDFLALNVGRAKDR